MGTDKEPPRADHLNLPGQGTEEVTRKLDKAITGKLEDAITGKLYKAITGKLNEAITRKLYKAITGKLYKAITEKLIIKAALKAGLKDNDDVKVALDTLTDGGEL